MAPKSKVNYGCWKAQHIFIVFTSHVAPIAEYLHLSTAQKARFYPQPTLPVVNYPFKSEFWFRYNTRLLKNLSYCLKLKKNIFQPLNTTNLVHFWHIQRSCITSANQIGTDTSIQLLPVLYATSIRQSANGQWAVCGCAVWGWDYFRRNICLMSRIFTCLLLLGSEKGMLQITQSSFHPRNG